MTSARGFSLVELLVVTSIIIALAGIAMVVYTSAQQKSRDARRKDDLLSITRALEIYYQKNGRYPCNSNIQYSATAAAFWITDTDCGTRIDFNNQYISALPKDPKDNTANFQDNNNDNKYGYAYWQVDHSGGSCPGGVGQYYILWTKLENLGDPDRNSTKEYKNCKGERIFLHSPNLSIVTSLGGQ